MMSWTPMDRAQFDLPYGTLAGRHKADVWILPAEPFELLPNVKWIQLYGVGVDWLHDHPVMKSDVILTNASGVSALSIAEHVIGFMLVHAKNLRGFSRLQQHHQWTTVETLGHLRHKTVGILGYGSIGREVARLCRAFRMEVLAISRTGAKADKGWHIPAHGDPHGRFPSRWYRPEQLHAMMRESDYFVICAPLTEKTRGMVTGNYLELLKSTSCLINVGRAAIVQMSPLIELLGEGKFWAYLDVFHSEPLPSYSALWDMPNVMLTPHCSGASSEHAMLFNRLFDENLDRYLSGKPLVNVIDKKEGY